MSYKLTKKLTSCVALNNLKSAVCSIIFFSYTAYLHCGICRCVNVFSLFQNNSLVQEWANYGPRDHFMWPAPADTYRNINLALISVKYGTFADVDDLPFLFFAFHLILSEK